MNNKVVEMYGHRLRTRVCGLCWQGNDLLLVEHTGLAESGFWAPPGGGVEYGERAGEALRREFMEETGLLIEPGEFAFGCEYINDPLHTIELFFTVTISGGSLRTGSDPELQIIKGVRFMSPGELAAIPDAFLHGLFRLARTKDAIGRLSGFYSI